MSQKKIITVIGPGESATASDIKDAETAGSLLADLGFIVLTGGRPFGVMEAALKGARGSGGETIAVLPGKDKTEASEYADIIIPTGMGQARNVINILSADLVIAIGLGAGTLSEIALAAKENKPLFIHGAHESTRSLINKLGHKQVEYGASIAELAEYLRNFK